MTTWPSQTCARDLIWKKAVVLLLAGQRTCIISCLKSQVSKKCSFDFTWIISIELCHYCLAMRINLPSRGKGKPSKSARHLETTIIKNFLRLNSSILFFDFVSQKFQAVAMKGKNYFNLVAFALCLIKRIYETHKLSRYSPPHKRNISFILYQPFCVRSSDESANIQISLCYESLECSSSNLLSVFNLSVKYLRKKLK